MQSVCFSGKETWENLDFGLFKTIFHVFPNLSQLSSNCKVELANIKMLEYVGIVLTLLLAFNSMDLFGIF